MADRPWLTFTQKKEWQIDPGSLLHRRCTSGLLMCTLTQHSLRRRNPINTSLEQRALVRRQPTCGTESWLKEGGTNRAVNLPYPVCTYVLSQWVLWIWGDKQVFQVAGRLLDLVLWRVTSSFLGRKAIVDTGSAMASCSMTLAYCLVSKSHSEMSALPSTVDVACPAPSSPCCSDSLQLRARKTLFLLERPQPPGQSVARACLDHCSTLRGHTKTCANIQRPSV